MQYREYELFKRTWIIKYCESDSFAFRSEGGRRVAGLPQRARADRVEEYGFAVVDGLYDLHRLAALHGGPGPDPAERVRRLLLSLRLDFTRVLCSRRARRQRHHHLQFAERYGLVDVVRVLGLLRRAAEHADSTRLSHHTKLYSSIQFLFYFLLSLISFDYCCCCFSCSCSCLLLH